MLKARYLYTVRLTKLFIGGSSFIQEECEKVSRVPLVVQGTR